MSQKPSPEREDGKMVEVVIGVLPAGRYELRPKVDGKVEVIRFDPPSKTDQGF